MNNKLSAKQTKMFQVAVSLNLTGVCLVIFTLFNEQYSNTTVEILAVVLLMFSLVLFGASVGTLLVKSKSK